MEQNSKGVRCEYELIVEEYFGYKMTDKDKFFNIDDTQLVNLVCFAHQKFGNSKIESQSLTPVQSDTVKCSGCGDKLVLIRGRYPKQESRLICPTCSYERLEQINEISSSHYGKAVSALSSPPKEIK